MSDGDEMTQEKIAPKESARSRAWLFWPIALGLLMGSFASVYFPLQTFLRPLLGEPVAGREAPAVVTDRARVIRATALAHGGEYVIEIHLENVGSSVWTPARFWLEPLTPDTPPISLPRGIDPAQRVDIQYYWRPDKAPGEAHWQLVGPRGPVANGRIRVSLPIPKE